MTASVGAVRSRHPAGQRLATSWAGEGRAFRSWRRELAGLPERGNPEAARGLLPALSRSNGRATSAAFRKRWPPHRGTEWTSARIAGRSAVLIQALLHRVALGCVKGVGLRRSELAARQRRGRRFIDCSLLLQLKVGKADTRLSQCRWTQLSKFLGRFSAFVLSPNSVLHV